MEREVKTLALIALLASLCFFTGMEIGTFAERQRTARDAMLRYMKTLEDTLNVSRDFIPPDPGTPPVSGAGEASE